MKIIFMLLIALSFSAFAEDEKVLCSAIVGTPFYKELKPMPLKDKTKHCSLSCYLALRCGAIESYHVGLIKEIADLLGAGNPEWADLRANSQGITLALSRRTTNKSQCLKECAQIYE